VKVINNELLQVEQTKSDKRNCDKTAMIVGIDLIQILRFSSLNVEFEWLTAKPLLRYLLDIKE